MIYNDVVRKRDQYTRKDEKRVKKHKVSPKRPHLIVFEFLWLQCNCETI